jgi:hypothetical protein
LDHAHPVERSFSWRGVAVALALVLVIALAALGGLAVLHRLAGTRPVPGTGMSRKDTLATKLRPRSRVSVLVLNGDGVAGAAGRAATTLLADGYRRAAAANAQSDEYARSVVLFRPGWISEAKRLAQDAHIGAVAPLDGRLPAPEDGFPLVAILGR